MRDLPLVMYWKGSIEMTLGSLLGKRATSREMRSSATFLQLLRTYLATWLEDASGSGDSDSDVASPGPSTSHQPGQ